MEHHIFNKIFNDIKPIQNPEELYWLINEVEKINPTTILEIGMEFGGTLLFWDYILKENGLLIEVDVQNILRWDVTKSKNDIKLIIQDSRKEETVNSVESILRYKNRKVDFLFIDGGHTENIVTSDYQIYSKFVKKGGIIGFHDVNDLIGVKQCWDKIIGNKESFTSNNNGIGIGIIRT